MERVWRGRDADELAGRRKALGWGTGQLARSAKVEERLVIGLESGEIGSIDEEHLARLATALETLPRTLCSGPLVQPKSTPAPVASHAAAAQPVTKTNKAAPGLRLGLAILLFCLLIVKACTFYQRPERPRVEKVVIPQQEPLDLSPSTSDSSDTVEMPPPPGLPGSRREVPADARERSPIERAEAPALGPLVLRMQSGVPAVSQLADLLKAAGGDSAQQLVIILLLDFDRDAASSSALLNGLIGDRLDTAPKSQPDPVLSRALGLSDGEPDPSLLPQLMSRMTDEQASLETRQAIALALQGTSADASAQALLKVHPPESSIPVAPTPDQAEAPDAEDDMMALAAAVSGAPDAADWALLENATDRLIASDDKAAMAPLVASMIEQTTDPRLLILLLRIGLATDQVATQAKIAELQAKQTLSVEDVVELKIESGQANDVTVNLPKLVSHALEGGDGEHRLIRLLMLGVQTSQREA
ncbi:MAG: hypothetical protein ABI743_00610, partial [bacterium]